MLKIDHFHIHEIWDIGEERNCNPFGNGHINDTFLLETAAEKYILQKVNKKVFRTRELVNNYHVLINSVDGYQSASGQKITPEIFKNRLGQYHYIDNNNSAWRLVEYIEDAIANDICLDLSVSYSAAAAFGKYQQFLNTINPDELQDTIVGFHDISERYKSFMLAVENADRKLLDAANHEVKKAMGYSSIVTEVNDMANELPLRLNHNDTKLNNVIFSKNKPFVIDLDTVMQGHMMFDFGDMVRTFTSPTYEDEKEIDKIKLRIDYFESLTRGYLSVIGDYLLGLEKQSLFFGALYIIYEQALRFLTDYLKGNVYYKVEYTDHNLIRTRTQLKLLSALIEQRKLLENIIMKP